MHHSKLITHDYPGPLGMGGKKPCPQTDCLQKLMTQLGINAQVKTTTRKRR